MTTEGTSITSPSSRDRAPQFQPDFHLTMVLGPGGVVRRVLESEGVAGFEEARAVGRHIADVAALSAGEARRQPWLDRVAAAHERAAPVHYTDRRPTQDPSERAFVDTLVTPVPGPDGALEAIVASFHDQTGRRQAEDLARSQQEHLRTALELTGLASYVFYLRETRMDTDARFDEIYGINPQRLVEEEGIDGFFDIMHEDDADAVRHALEIAMDGSVDYVASYRLRAHRPGGKREIRHIEALGRVESDEHGPFRVVGVIEDVTERRQEEAARLRLQKRDAIGTLAGGIAHDFNNVIGAILSNAYVAEAEVAAGESPATSLREMTRGAKRAAELVGRLLTFSREEEPRRETVELTPVIDEACALLRTTLPRGALLQQSVAAGLPPVLGDSTQLHQVAVNLISNAAQAIKATPKGQGEIAVRLDEVGLDGPTPVDGVTLPAGPYLRIRVSDDGPGIPDAILAQMFDPFFTTKPAGEGTGLGLTACQTIVRAHQGAIAVETTPGQGTSFTVLVPAATPQARERPRAVAAPRRAAGDSLPRVLFVDDETALVRLAARAMPQSGCDAVAFSDPREALEAFEAAPGAFDALVSDLSMPGMGGLELVDAVRAIRPGLPIVICSGYVTSQAAADARARGVDRIVSKPCAIETVAAAVLEVLDGERAQAVSSAGSPKSG